MKGAAPVRVTALRERRLAASTPNTATPQKSSPEDKSTDGGCAAEDEYATDDIQIHTAVTSTHLRYFGMLSIQHMICTCGTVVAVHDSRNMTVEQYQQVIGSKRPCCVRFFTLMRLTFCSDFDVKIGPQGQDVTTTRKIVKISAAVRRPLDNVPARDWKNEQVETSQSVTFRAGC